MTLVVQFASSLTSDCVDRSTGAAAFTEGTCDSMASRSSCVSVGIEPKPPRTPPDVDEPGKSALFQKHPTVTNDHHLVEFITDYLRMMVSGNMNPLEIENLMDQEIDTHHHEAMAPSHALQKAGDGLPAFGIVAAVMGVVKTMASVGQPPAILGQMIAAALVGTFLGILISYGFVSPLAQLLEQKVDEATKELHCVKATLLASLQGYAPAVAVEFGRKILYSTERPTFVELEKHVKQKR